MNSGTILHVFPTFDVGGAQSRLATLANAFGARYRHQIVAMNCGFGCAEKFTSGVSFATHMPPAAGESFVARILAYRGFMSRLSPDLLVTYNWGAIDWALANLTGLVPHVHIEDGFGPDEAVRQLRRRVVLRSVALRRARLVVVPSVNLYRIATEIWKLPRRVLTYIPNGIDCAAFAPPWDAELCLALGIPDNRLVVGTVAALRPEKNLKRLIAAFARIPADLQAALVIVGEGSERRALEAFARESGVADRVVFVGHQKAVERIMSRFDVFALSSDTEQMPISLVEAMAAGVAVASVNVGDVRNMVAAENAEFVVAKDEEALGSAIESLLHDRDLRERLGASNARKAAEKFTVARMCERYATIFDGRFSPSSP